MAPLPKPPETRRRRNHGPQITFLPAEGRKGRAPAWPFAERRPGEIALWNKLWKMPEATVWEREMSHRLVARYVRIAAAAESMMNDNARYLWSEMRQLEDRLLLTPKSKVQNRYAVREAAEVVAGPGAVVSSSPTGMSPAERLAAAAS